MPDDAAPLGVDASSPDTELPPLRKIVVIGGGVARAGAVLFDPLRGALGTYAGLDFLRDIEVVPAALGADAGLVGAAALAREER